MDILAKPRKPAPDFLNESTNDLHFRLGKACEARDGVLYTIDPNGRPLDSNRRHFEGLQLEVAVRRPSLPISREVEAEADRQWGEIPDTPEEIKAWMRGDPV